MSTTDPTIPGSPPRPRRLVIRDVAVLDATGREPEGRGDVLVEDGVIIRVERGGGGSRGGLGPVEGAVVIDGAGCTLLPGLMAAHVHFALIGPKGDHGSDTWIGHVLSVARVIEGALDEGFTTVRDAGGLEPAWAQAVATGQPRGPRILPSGSAISQTGGHADDRQRHQAKHAGVTIPGLVAGHVIADGIDEIRRAAREQLRRGATQIKLMASGGIINPTDPFDSRSRHPMRPRGTPIVKTARQRLDILTTYDDLGSYRAAAAVCGTTHNTVWRVLERRAAPPVERPPRRRLTDPHRERIAARVRQSDGHISAKRLLPLLRAEGYAGSARSLRRAVALGPLLGRSLVLGAERPAHRALGQIGIAVHGRMMRALHGQGDQGHGRQVVSFSPSGMTGYAPCLTSFISVDTGKYTLAPLLAERAVERVMRSLASLSHGAIHG